MNNESDQMFLAILTHDISLAGQVIVKILAGLFLSPDAIAIYVVFILGFFIYWLKSELDRPC